MQIVLMIAIAAHVVPAVFWAGTTFAIARTGGVGAETFLRPQLGAAGVTIVVGTLLFWLLHRHAFGRPEMILAFGALCAIAAAALQGALAGPAVRGRAAGTMPEAEATARIAKAYRYAAPLLVIALICMVIQRYA